MGVTLVAHTLKRVESFKELSHRLDQVVGVPFAELTQYSRSAWKGNAAHNKGWAGQLVTRLAGDDSGGAATADLSQLGIEVKSVPIGLNARVLQPTKVCAIDYADVYNEIWWESAPFHKLRAVLFVPVVKLDPKSPNHWFIRRPFLWTPSEQVLAQFKRDYDSVRKIVRQFEFERIRSAEPPKGQGVLLHPKPNARKGKTTALYRINGESYRIKKKGWMLRKSFTQPILSEQLKVDIQLGDST
ncbi:MAG: MutH/Sau3AI family endonuclease [Thermoplasmata archaeon]